MVSYKIIEKKTYTVKLFCPELKELVLEQQNNFKNCLEKEVDPENSHVGLKYIGYFDNYSEEEILELVPELISIIKSYLPIKITIKEVNGFWNSEEWPCKPIIFLKVEKTKKLLELHDKLRSLLNKKFDTFELAEGNNYTPHVTIGVGFEEDEEKLKHLIKKINFGKKSFLIEKASMNLVSDKNKIIFP